MLPCQRAPIKESIMPTDYALLSTYPPTQCGLATFSAALLAHLPEPGDNVGVVRVLDEPAPRNSPLIVHDLVNSCAASAAAAVGIIDGFDVAIVQHEYGIYGGHDGEDLIPLLNALTVPSIVVLHTVLADPTDHQRMVLDAVISAADTIVTMTRTGRARVRASSGESYRKSLQALARARGVDDSVHFDGRYLPVSALVDLVGTADVVLLPYDSVEQVTSGVLIEAVTAAKPVISTRFPHAVELLSDGAGLLIERQDPAGIAAALRRALTEPGLSERMSRRAAGIAPQLLWPAVASCYRELAATLTRIPAGATL